MKAVARIADLAASSIATLKAKSTFAATSRGVQVCRQAGNARAPRAAVSPRRFETCCHPMNVKKEKTVRQTGSTQVRTGAC